MKIRLAFLFFILASTLSHTKAQTLDDAKTWLQEGRYADALPVFRAEYETNPDNTPLNLWLGICEYETGNLSRAEKHLQFASRKNQAEAYLYLGDLYVRAYRLKDAETEFAKYEKAKRRDKTALAQLKPKRQYASRIANLLQKVEDVQIIDSIVVKEADFLSAYPLSAASGSLLPMSAFFKGQDTNNNVLFLNERKDKVYFPQGDSTSGLDIYTMEKLLDNFGNQKRLPASVNTPADEAYPFVMPDGLTLYFASNRDESIGGYDLFVTRYNLANDSYLNPGWLNMPFNSPFNDYMMAIDEERGIGWFVSDRHQPRGYVCVYTFIPSATVSLLENNDAEYLARRAQISSIRDSWRQGVDYSPLLTAAQSPAAQPGGDFSFVINNGRTYRSWSDFGSPQARDLFAQAMDKEKQLAAMKQELTRKRRQFADTKGDNASLRTSILQLERETETLWKEIERLKIQSRNQEIKNKSR